MITVFISFIFFAFAYTVKGASIPWIVRKLEKLKSKSSVLDKILSADAVASAMVFLFSLIIIQDIKASALLAVGFWLSASPSMGEEHGAVGRIGNSWGEYIDKGFGRSYGIKKAVQRGVWIGACMALATGYIPFICFSLLFVPCIFIGQELNYRILKKDGWAIAEPIIGAFVYGIPTGLYMGA